MTYLQLVSSWLLLVLSPVGLAIIVSCFFPKIK